MKLDIKKIENDLKLIKPEIYKNGQYIAEVMTDLIGNAKIELQEANYTAKVFDLPLPVFPNIPI